MKTIFPHLNTAHHQYYKNYEHIAGDRNRNALISQAEYQRDACEKELYRLRFGIEQLLGNSEQGDSRERYRSKSGFVSDMKNRSWFERCTPCCRRWRGTRYDDYQQFSSQTPRYNDSFISPSPSRSSRYINRSKNKNAKNSFSRTTPDRTMISNLLVSKNIDDPVYQSLILKILEAKALDCLCDGYSKQNIQQQISQTLTQLNQRTRDHQWDSASVSSSTFSPTSYDSSSSVSTASNLSNDESVSSPSITPHSSSPSPISMQTPNRSLATSPSIVSPIRSTENESSKIKSKVTIIEDKKRSPSKSKTKRKVSSKRHKKSGKPKSSSKKKSSKPKSSKKKSSKPKSSKSKRRKTSSKSPSRSKKHKSKPKKKSKKPKSNNQVDDGESTLIYPQAFETTHENRRYFFDPLYFELSSVVPDGFNYRHNIFHSSPED